MFSHCKNYKMGKGRTVNLTGLNRMFCLPHKDLLLNSETLVLRQRIWTGTWWADIQAKIPLDNCFQKLPSWITIKTVIDKKKSIGSQLYICQGSFKDNVTQYLQTTFCHCLGSRVTWVPGGGRLGAVLAFAEVKPRLMCTGHLDSHLRFGLGSA